MTPLQGLIDNHNCSVYGKANYDMPLDFNILEHVPSEYQPYRPLKGEAPADCINLDLSTDESMEITEEEEHSEAKGQAIDLESAKSESQATDLADGTSTGPTSDLADAKSTTEREATSETARSTSDLANAESETARSTADLAQAKSKTSRSTSDLAQAKSKTTRSTSDLAEAKSKTTRSTSDLAQAKSTKTDQRTNVAEMMDVDQSPSSQAKTAATKNFCTTSKKPKRPKLNIGTRFNWQSNWQSASAYHQQKKKPEKVKLDMAKLRSYAKTVAAKYDFSPSVCTFQC